MRPTWEDVKVPKVIIQALKRLPPCVALDSLVYQLIFHRQRKLFHTYHCDSCGQHFRPERSTEEVSLCPECNSPRLRCISTALRFGREIPAYSRPSNEKLPLAELVQATVSNHLKYFGVFGTLPDCGWNSVGYYCQFAQGERTTDRSARNCLVKAAILCPYLWDRQFNWSGTGTNPMTEEHLSPVLFNFCVPSWLGKPLE